ncbi:hypothetical protein [Mesorhizobium sp.]|uniref:DUF6953 family protein n=1 Tax=Mesorhizobium sp. TaxID=1871066 RepID=UPI000FE57D9E|nr:hypothetical protein [Mesorhizobium sp.]RWK76263.1 MAG: hypothetical protein EOR50_14810 [Mesorhizobium sp.]RWK81022.1 MAG: hypothetical protein EOR51_16370 [Mesorhizobium sp.]RWL08343.1 MAG: hypothetical protein EOR55_04085 [Mesorhizobium sp.]RWL12142.1 MAG: hypothetical protein EOR56_15035 [Mesorhizobium sp.]
MSVSDAAALMVRLLEEHNYLRQDDAANQLHMSFGDEYVYFNQQGNLAIKAEVLAAFKKLTPDTVWFRSSRYWRKREAGDLPGRMQPY